MLNATDDTPVATLIAEQAINAILDRYCQALDRMFAAQAGEGEDAC